MSIPPQAGAVMRERFGGDALIALATVENGLPQVRTVNSHYADGAFYVITHALSNKMRQIRAQPRVAVSGEWFTGHGVAEDLGPLMAADNRALRDCLRQAFAAWYDNGHTDEHDPDTHILRIRLTDAVLLSHGTRYDLIF